MKQPARSGEDVISRQRPAIQAELPLMFPVLPQNRKYLGSKFRLLDFLKETILSRAGRFEVFADLFAGTGIVGKCFNNRDCRVIANDLLYSNYVVNRAFLTSRGDNVDLERLGDLTPELNASPPIEGYVFHSYGGTYFSRDNAAKIDAVRQAIDRVYEAGRCSEQERYVLLAGLLLAVDKVANTVGQYDAFLKHIDREDLNSSERHLRDSNVDKPLRLLLPALDIDANGGNEVYNTDANLLVRDLEADVLYLDPPYNTRQYVDCYHVLENIMRWEKPRLYGKTKKFQRDNLKSRFSRKSEAFQALSELIEAARAEHIFLSYNSEGVIDAEAIAGIFREKGRLEVFEKEYPVFGNGAGSSRKRTVTERIFYCRNGGGGGGKRSQQKIELFTETGESRGFYSPRNRLNDLTGKEWVYWSKSVINKPYPPNLQHSLRSRHGGQKPPDLCGDLIEVFSKRGQWVLDPFAGVGGTLLGASLRGRQALGIEINPEWIDIYRQVCSLEKIEEQRTICGDSRVELDRLAAKNWLCDLILTDVPFWSMDKAKRSRGEFKRVGEQQHKRRRSKLGTFNDTTYGSKEQWLAEMKVIFEAALPLLKDRGYVVVFIGEMYQGGRYHFLSAELGSVLSELGLTAKANLVWYDVSKSLHIYGYQYEYIPSLIHQNILVYRKDSTKL